MRKKKEEEKHEKKMKPNTSVTKKNTRSSFKSSIMEIIFKCFFLDEGDDIFIVTRKLLQYLVKLSHRVHFRCQCSKQGWDVIFCSKHTKKKKEKKKRNATKEKNKKRKKQDSPNNRGQE